MDIVQLDSIDGQAPGDIRGLIRQLSQTAPLPNLNAMLAEGSTKLFVAREDARIVGMLSLVIFRIPTLA